MNEVMGKRAALINDPSEVVDGLELEAMSIEAVEKTIQALMDKMGFKLANRLLTPITFFAICNTFAQEIEVLQSDLVFHFDPRAIGMIPENI